MDKEYLHQYEQYFMISPFLAAILAILLSACLGRPSLQTPIVVSTLISSSESDKPAIQTIIRAIEGQKAQPLLPFLHEEGVYFIVKWPGGVDPNRYYSKNTSYDIFVDALKRGSPSCEGYNPKWGGTTSLKTFIVFMGLPIDWISLGYQDYHGDVTGLVLNQSKQGLEITSVLSVDPRSHMREIVDLIQCPRGE